MNVLIINDYARLEGGAERFIQNLLLESDPLPLTFHRVNIEELLSSIGKPTHQNIWNSRLNRLLLYPEMVNALLNHIQLLKPDLIHLNTCALYTRSVLRALRLSGIPVACFIHDYYTLRRLNSLWFTRETLSFTFLTHAPDIFDKLRAMGRNVHLVKVPFHVSRWSGDSHPHSAYQTDLLYVGRIKREKGVFTLIKAIDLIRHTIPDIHLVLLGDGPSLKALQREIVRRGLQSHVHIRGRQSDPELIKYYHNARLLVLPSSMETLGYVGLEAQASGLPVIAFRNPGTIRWCQHEINGFLVDPLTAENLAKKVTDIIRDDVILRRISTAAREHIGRGEYNATDQPITDLYKVILAW